MLVLGGIVPAFAGDDPSTANEHGAFLQSFFESNCVKCHGAKKAKGGIRLDQMGGKIALGHDFETWNAIHEQLSSGEMPPEDTEVQPAATERAKERDVKISTYSLPITVRVTAPPPKEEGK